MHTRKGHLGFLRKRGLPVEPIREVKTTPKTRTLASIKTGCSDQLTRGYSNVHKKTDFHLHLLPSTGARFHSFLTGDFSHPESEGDSRFDLPEVLSLALPGFIHSFGF